MVSWPALTRLRFSGAHSSAVSDGLALSDAEDDELDADDELGSAELDAPPEVSWAQAARRRAEAARAVTARERRCMKSPQRVGQAASCLMRIATLAPTAATTAPPSQMTL